MTPAQLTTRLQQGDGLPMTGQTEGPETCDAITIRHLETEADQEAALVELMGVMGFEIHEIDGEEFLLPTDPAHPDYGGCLRNIQRAEKRLTKRGGNDAR